MPKETDKNYLEALESDAEAAAGPVCNIDPDLLQNDDYSSEQLCIQGMREYDNGQMIKALQYYMTALTLKPDFIPALLGTTCVLVAMERYQEAQSYLDYVFKLDPDIKDAKLLRNIINNAKSGYPAFEDVDHLPDDYDEDEPSSDAPKAKNLKPYLIGVLIVVLCYLLASPFWRNQETARPAPSADAIRQSLASEPGLKNRDITVTRRGEAIILSGRVANQAERRLAIVIAENESGALKVNSSSLKIGEKSSPSAQKETKSENKKNRTYVVKQGDTLSLIARKYYGDGNYWKKILDANPGKMSDPDGVKPGMELIIPE